MTGRRVAGTLRVDRLPQSFLGERPGGTGIFVRVPASSANLGSGFDTLSLALDLHLTVRMRLTPDQARPPRLSGEGAEELKGNTAGNLLLRAAEALLQRTGKGALLPHLELVARNQIPVGKGLGSSAAAIVAGLYGANELIGRPLGTRQLRDMAVALEGHPDNVAAALLGGFTVSTQEVSLRLAAPEGLRFLALVPDEPLLTEKSRAVLPTTVPFATLTDAVQRATTLVAALSLSASATSLRSSTAPLGALTTRSRPTTARARDEAGEALQLLGTLARGGFHEDVRARLVPGLSQALALLRGAGVPATLSGSGPTLLIWQSVWQALSAELFDQVCAALTSAGTTYHLLRLRPARRGAVIRVWHSRDVAS